MRLTPATRISFGLVLLTISLLLLGKMIGFAPDRTAAVLASRKHLAETLAIQFSAAIQRDDIAVIRQTMDMMIEHNSDIRSAALRDSTGTLIAESGNHLAHWLAPENTKPTPPHNQTPLLKGPTRWGTVELSFAPLWVNNFRDGLKNSYLSLILFVACAGFGGYFLLIKRTLRELGPSTVIPARVRAAFDVLKEGVLLLDEKEHIVLANSAFAALVDRTPEKLIGFKGSELGWKGYRSPQHRAHLPWMSVIRGETSQKGTRLILEHADRSTTTLMVNVAPILDGKGASRGVLVTFDDVTELEEKNLELNQAVNKLKLTTEEVQLKNKELEFLADHDPLTLLLNRRAFNRKFKDEFQKARLDNSQLSCIMCDIDHFKNVNDTYGHATGDKVIRMAAAMLQRYFREDDLIGRYGGEEFCIVLPGIDITLASQIANRVRQAIENDNSTGVRVTMSFGVSCLECGALEPEGLSNEADKALYVAKESGRNRVVRWGEEEPLPHEEQPPAATEENEGFAALPEEDGSQDPQHRELAERRSQELKHYTAYDVLTGLPNRTLFYDRVSQALVRGRRHDTIASVMAITADAVQRVTETLGRALGDELFKEIGNRLHATLRKEDTVARLHTPIINPTLARLGDEKFGVLLSDLEDVDAITWVAQRIIKAFTEPFAIDGKNIHAPLSIGISIFPFDAENPEELEKLAATAQRHTSRELGVNRFSYYSKNINAISTKHLQLESQLHSALDNNELELHFQPKIMARSGTILGVEALVRWRHPKAGQIPPDEFIHIAEYSGIINRLGNWVLDAACNQMRIWLDMGLSNCNVAINLSSKQFRQEDLVDQIESTLNRYSLDPGLLTFEVTESTMMENIGNATKILNNIKALGAGIVLDDFGTGYSSLGYLKDFPVSHVKIDRSFIADLATDDRAATLVRSIIDMAHALGLQITAEGVEEQIQADMLLEFGCDEMQGYLFGRPLPAESMTKLLTASHQALLHSTSH